MPPQSNTKWYTIIAILIILLIASFTWGILNTKSGVRVSPISNQTPNANSGLFDFQNATFTGKITKIEGNRIWLENQRGVTGTAVLAPNYLVTDMEKLTTATPSGNFQQPEIELNKNATISLQFINGEYQVTSISFIPSVGSPIVPNSVTTSIPPAPSFVPLPSGPILLNPSATPSSR